MPYNGCLTAEQFLFYEMRIVSKHFGRDYVGQLVQVTIALQSGEIHVIGAYGSFMFLDGRCYRTKYEPSERLNAFGNGILKRQ